MLKSLAVLSVLLALPAHAAECVKNDFTLVPYRQAGLISSDDTESTLIGKLGSQYRRVAIYLGDGYFRCGGVVYPNSNAEAFLLWSGVHADQLMDKDLSQKITDKGIPGPLVLEAQSERTCSPLDYGKSNPESISISQRAWSASPWRTCDGIRLGMDYNELVRAYKPPFTVAEGGAYAEIEGFRLSFDVRPLINSNQNMFGAGVREQFQKEEDAIASGFSSGEEKFSYHNLRVNQLEMLLNTTQHTVPTEEAPKPGKKKAAAAPKKKSAPAENKAKQ